MKTWLNQDEAIIEHHHEFYNWQYVANTFFELRRFSQCPNITKLARRYLATPISSVYSERLFSEMGQVYEVMEEYLYISTNRNDYKDDKKIQVLSIEEN